MGENIFPSHGHWRIALAPPFLNKTKQKLLSSSRKRTAATQPRALCYNFEPRKGRHRSNGGSRGGSRERVTVSAAATVASAAAVVENLPSLQQDLYFLEQSKKRPFGHRLGRNIFNRRTSEKKEKKEK